MELVKHNIEREEKFVSLFGYSIIESKKNNRWNIINKNNKSIGFIIYKELKSDKESLELDNTNEKKYGYQMIIHSDEIDYNLTRKDNAIYTSHFFSIKSKKYGAVTVSLNFGDELSLIMYSNEDEQKESVEKSIDWINCVISDEIFQLQMKSRTENFNTYELLLYEPNPANTTESCQYWLKYRNKPFEIDDYNNPGSKIRSIKAVSNPYDRQVNRMVITEEAWIDGKQTVNTSCTVSGTVKDLAEKQELGINAINHFRYLANDVFPFEEDIIDKLCSGLIGKRDDLAIFIPEFGSQYQKQLQYK